MIIVDERFERHQTLSQLVAERTEPKQLAHDLLHVNRVYRWCLHLADNYDVNVDLAGACGLVHDLVHIPKDSPDRPLGSEQSAAAAQSLLTEAGYTDEEQEEIVEAVRTCSWSRGLTAQSDMGRILQDADRLDAIGVIGASRCFTCAQEIADEDSCLYNPVDPLHAAERDLDDRHYALDHFFAKLMKLADSMNFPLAQAEAQRRQTAMEQFIWHFGAEVADPVKT